MKDIVTSVEQLEEIYGTPAATAVVKVANHITPEYRAWIEASPFCALATVGPEGVDATPRGDQGQVVFVLDPRTLALPDRRGNNRIDSLRNVVCDPRVALMLLVPGLGTAIRVNGQGRVSVNASLLERFSVNGQMPRSVLLIEVEEIYTQCARAVMRAGLWESTARVDPGILPTVGDILAALSKGELGGSAYDESWDARARTTLW